MPAGAENGGGGTGHHGTVVLSTAPARALRATAAGHYAPADLMIFLDVLLALDIDCHPLTSHSILSIERRCAAIYYLLPSSAHQAFKLLREQQKCWSAIKLWNSRICFPAVPQFCPFSQLVLLPQRQLDFTGHRIALNANSVPRSVHRTS